MNICIWCNLINKSFALCDNYSFFKTDTVNTHSLIGIALIKYDKMCICLQVIDVDNQMCIVITDHMVVV